jgi:phosphoglycolate phosphatase-like HAD superfamily hydrolase
MNEEKPLLVFDFDGVISDSLHDSYLTSLNTYVGLTPEHDLPITAQLDPPHKIFKFEKTYPQIFKSFRRLIPMGNRAEDYCILWYAIDSGTAKNIRSQSDFDKITKILPKKRLNAYAKAFYKYRKMLQEQDVQHWIKLSPVFDGIPEAVACLSDRFKLAIATSKDLRSVHLLLKNYGVFRFFKPKFILDKDFSYNKRDHLIYFHKQYGIPFQTMHFIDDKVLHLLSVKDLGVKGYLALWGYNTKKEHIIAEQEGFRFLTIEGLNNLQK